MITILDEYKWNTSPTAYCTIGYEYQRVGSAMQYRLNWEVWLAYSDSYYNNGLRFDFTFDSAYTYNTTIKGYSLTNKNWRYSGTTSWMNVPSKTSGTTSLNIAIVDTSTNATKMSYNTTLIVEYVASELTLNFTEFDIENSMPMQITKYDSSLKDTLTIYCISTANVVKVIEGIENGDVVKFTDAEKAQIYSLMKKLNRATFSFHLTTRTADGALLNNSIEDATGIISNATPTFDDTYISYYDNDDTTIAVTNNNVIVQNKSSLVLNISSAILYKGATLDRYDIYINGINKKTVSGSGEVAFGKITECGSVTLQVRAVDSRGNVAMAQKVINVIEYKTPNATVNLKRVNNYEDETKLMVNAIYSAVENYNSVNITYKYGKVNEDYSPDAEIASNTEYTLTCDKSSAYNFTIAVVDSFGERFEYKTILSKGLMPLFIDTKKNAIGINAFPQDKEALRVGNGVATFLDGIVLKSSTTGSEKLFKISVDDSGALSITEFN